MRFFFHFFNFKNIYFLKTFRLVTSSDATTNGLIVSYLLPLTTMTAPLVYPLIIMGKCSVSIQRLQEYAKWTVHEKKFFTPKAPENWPSKGVIQARNLSVRYRKGLPLVLDSINFDINSGEKVAIIGRTGSGTLYSPPLKINPF